MRRTILLLAATAALTGCGAELPLDPEPRVQSVALEARPGDVAVLQDGRFLVALDGGIVRYLPDGAVDRTFGVDGFRKVDLVEPRLAVDLDRIYVSGRYPAIIFSDYGFVSRVMVFDLEGAAVEDWGPEGFRSFPGLEIQAISPSLAGPIIAGILDSQVVWARLERRGAEAAIETYDPPEDVRVLAVTGRRVLLGSTAGPLGPMAAGYELTMNGSFWPIGPGRRDLDIRRLDQTDGVFLGCGSRNGVTVVFRISDGDLPSEIEDIAELPGDGFCLDFVVDGSTSYVLFADATRGEVVVRSVDRLGRELPALPARFSAPWTSSLGTGALARRADGTLLFAFGDREDARLVMLEAAR